MSNEEVVCTPDLVVANLRLNDLTRYPPGTKIQVQDPIHLMPPIVTDVHEKFSLISDNFRSITRSVIDNIDKTRSKVEDIEKKLESVTVDVYRNLFEQCMNEINRTISSLNMSKNKLMLDRVNLLGQSKIGVGESTTSFNQPSALRNNLLNARKMSQSITNAVSSVTNASTAPTNSTLTAIQNNSHFISSSDLLTNIVHKKEDIAMLKRQEKLKTRRLKRIQKKLLQRTEPCYVKIRKVDLTKLRDDYIRSKSKINNSINHVIVTELNGEHMHVDTDTDQNQNFVNELCNGSSTLNPQPASKPEQRIDQILKNDSISIQSILVSSSPVNVSKITKSVTFAPDVVFDTSS